MNSILALMLITLTVQLGQSFEGIRLVLVNDAGTVIDELEAPSSGVYSFEDLRDGIYTIRAVFGETIVASVPEIHVPSTNSVTLDMPQEAVDRAAASGEQSAGGQRNQNIQVNLIDNEALTEQLGRSGADVQPITDFSAVRRNYAAEFGGLGRNIEISRADHQNAFHGDFFEYHQNSVFNARSFFQVGDVKPSRRNQYGFRFGGPLGLDGLSFVLTGEETREAGAVNGNVLVPLPSERKPLSDNPKVRSLVERWLAAYPTELPNRPEIDPRMLNTNANQTVRNSGGSLAIYWKINEGNDFTARYLLRDVFIDSFEFVDGLNPDQRLRPQTLNLSLATRLSPDTSLSVGVNYIRRKIHLLVPPAAVGPMVTMARVIENLGPYMQFPILRAQNDFEYLVQGTTKAGDHQMNWGTEVRRFQMNDLQSDDARGMFNFRPNFGNSAIENLLLGLPSRYAKSLGNLYRGFRYTDFNLFFNDRWKVMQNLDLTLGLRYEYAGAPSEVNDLTKFPYSSDANNFAPRFGFAYSKGDTVIRGGYGIAFGRVFPVTFQSARFNPPTVVKVSLQSPNILSPLGGVKLAGGNEPVRSSLNLIDPNLVVPYAQQYTLQVERRLTQSTNIVASYVGSRVWKLFQNLHSNRAGRPEGIPITTATINDRRPDQNVFNIKTITNMGRAYFDAAQLRLDQVFNAGLSFRATYTFSKAIDTGTDFSSTALGNDETREQREDAVIQGLRALSKFDSPHALVLGYRWEIPGRFMRGWSISGTALFRSGTPFSLETGTDAPPVGNVDGVRQDRPTILNPSLLGRSIDHPDTSQSILTADSFSVEATFRNGFGNLARNTFRKDGTSNLNLSIAKEFSLSSDQNRSLTFRTEITNLTNHPQFAEPNFQVKSPSFGRITNTLNAGRMLQFGLQFQF